DRKIASDNIQVKPLSISSIIFYKIKDNTENKNDSIKFIQDIIYNQEMITVVDVDNEIEYGDLFISAFNIEKKYKEGFLANIEFRYNPITETASGKSQYDGYSIRSERVIQKPLAKTQVAVGNLPKKTMYSLMESGEITYEDLLNEDLEWGGEEGLGIGGDLGDEGILGMENFERLDFNDPDSILLDKLVNVNYLDFDSELLNSGMSEKIQTNVGGFNGVFELNPDGTFDIFDTIGEPIRMGQKILTDVELLANTVPGANVSLKLLPITREASSALFDMSRLNKDFVLKVSNLQDSIDKL
ncbi:MAG: hypothetical protein ACRDCE_19725, partial [Cetobacterium sp.]|uniref:hypothetical protein n=1 Tax=Cetobacterium sp. TaxID=2071632 RepID=UPI003EE4B820